MQRASAKSHKKLHGQSVVHQSISARVRSLSRVAVTAEDRRRDARVALELPLRYAIKGERVTLEATLGDISAGGMFIRTPTPPLVGQTVACGFVVDDDSEAIIAVRGEVAWRTISGPLAQRGFGIRVVLADRKHRQRIESLLAEAAPPDVVTFSVDAQQLAAERASS